MFLSFASLKLRILIFIFLLLLNINDCLENEKRAKSNILTTAVNANLYNMLKNAVGQVLYRSNNSVFDPVNPEADYDYTNKDNPDVEEPPANIFEYNRKNGSVKHFPSKSKATDHHYDRYEEMLYHDRLKEPEDEDYYDPELDTPELYNSEIDRNQNINTYENENANKQEMKIHTTKNKEKENDDRYGMGFHTSKSNEKVNENQQEAKFHTDANDKVTMGEKNDHSSSPNQEEELNSSYKRIQSINHEDKIKKEEREFHGSRSNHKMKFSKEEREFYGSKLNQKEKGQADERELHGAKYKHKDKSNTEETGENITSKNEKQTDEEQPQFHSSKQNQNQNKESEKRPIQNPYEMFSTSMKAEKTNKKRPFLPTFSLYDKYKAKLDPLVHQLNINMEQELPHHKQDYTKILNNIKHGSERNIVEINDGLSQLKPKKKFASLYEEFKKRLLAFSDELGVDSGLIDKKTQIKNVGKIQIYGNTSRTNDEGMTAEFQKVKKVVDRIEKTNPGQLLLHSTLGDHIKNSSTKSVLSFDSKLELKPAKVVDEDYLKYHNYHRIYSGPQPATSGGFINNDYDYNDNKNEKSNSKYGKKLSLLTAWPLAYRTKKNAQMATSALIGQGTDGSNYNPFYPAVLTDPVHSPYGPPSNLTPRSLLENIAQQLNITTLDVARRVAEIRDLNLSSLNKDPKLHNALQKFIENSVVRATQSANVVGSPQLNVNSNDGAQMLSSVNKVQPAVTAAPVAKTYGIATPGALGPQTSPSDQYNPNIEPTSQVRPQTFPSGQYNPNLEQALKIQPNIQRINAAPQRKYPIPEHGILIQPVQTNNVKPSNESTPQKAASLSEGQISEILEKLVNKIDEIHGEKSESNGETSDDDDDCTIDDNPCWLAGAWLSHAMGIRFNINPECNVDLNCMPTEARSIPLNISIVDCTPPKRHIIIGTDWPITGNAIKEVGGPFFFYTQKRSENILATFVGYCRTCNGVDSIYGTWSISSPSKDCHDTPTSFQTKTDIMRRYSLDEKRKQRYKDLLYKNSKYSKIP